MSVQVSRWCVVLLMSWPLVACGGAQSGVPVDTLRPPQGGAEITGRLLARSARLTLEVDDEDDFPSTIRAVAAQAEPLDGYLVSMSARQVVFKVPSDRLEAALDAVAHHGRVTDRALEVTDVTAAHTDLTVRLKNLRASQVRLRELIALAKDVKTVLDVERELARVTTELERQEAQMRLLSNQIAMARVQVDLESAVRPGPIGWIGWGLYHGVKWLFVWD